MNRYVGVDEIENATYQEEDLRGMGEHIAYRVGWNEAIEYILENAPSIDIVRCGECKYYIDNTCDCYSLYGDLSGDLIGVFFEPNEDFFCSYGSRSEKPNNSKERSSE